MLEGVRVIDAHVHAACLPTLKLSLGEWTGHFEGGVADLLELYDEQGTLIPRRFDEYVAGEGVDVAVLLCEYSPRVTGIQPIEDLLPIVEHNPERFRLMAALNPHYHYPLPDELERQMTLGAVGLKLHPVHGGFSPNDPALYPVYWLCQQRGLPVIFHCGTSVFPGATNRYADPVLVEYVARDFPDLTIVLAHGGRGWWYDAAAFMTLMRENVWIEVSGLPPKKLPEYYSRYNFESLAQKMIFGTDWPGVPGLKNNALALLELGLDPETVELILHENASRLYKLDAKQDGAACN
ncbi:MAG: amidohydrolase family protein [Actinomycetota bacterium]|nr:amidohydrolase family protein [Actinomycetota bacterium]